jgi:small subunit ribosomal protein S5
MIEKNIMRQRGRGREREVKEYDERVIEVARVSRVVKGGRRIRFRALVVLGNHTGKLGMGIAKANEVADAVRKATALAKKNFVQIPIINGTIPHEVFVKHGGAKVLLKPASSGTSIVAGGSIRQVAELAGISDLLSKSLGSSNKINIVTATIKALTSFNPDIVEKVKCISEKKGIEAAPVKAPKEEVKVEPVVVVEEVKEEKTVKAPVKAKKTIKK